MHKKYTLFKYNLQDSGIVIYRETVFDNHIELKIGRIRKDALCSCCNLRTSYHYDTRTNSSKIRHLDFYDKKVFLLFKKRRFKCRHCSKIFTEQFSKLLKPYQRKTNHFSSAAMGHLKTHNFKDTQIKLKVSFSYLINQLYDLVPHDVRAIDWSKEFQNNDTISLGIDEHGHKKRKLVLTIANLTKKKLITILPAYSQRELTKFLRSMPSNFRNRIAYAATDLTNRYGKEIKKWLPKIKISADNFHIIRRLNYLLWQEKQVIEGIYRMHKIKYFKLLLKGKERLTKEQQEKVNRILEIKRYQKLKKAYELKEKVRYILKKERDRKEARQEFINLAHSDVWNRNNCNREELLRYSKYYRTSIETLKAWREEIITLIETRITNGYTEGIHTKIKLLKRQSYGIKNTTTYIKRVILGLSNDILPDSLHYV